MSERTAFLDQIFSSIQGEGLYCGVRQIFIRFSLCNLSCSYCDAPESRQKKEAFLIEKDAGSGIYLKEPNPVGIKRLLRVINGFLLWKHHSISLTGGEPLLQADFLENLLPELRSRGCGTYLETNGTLPEKLERILPYLDIMAMDIKLPSVCGPGIGDPGKIFEIHREFLSIAAKSPETELFVKMVVSDGMDRSEFKAACGILSGISNEIPLIIQPVTDSDGRIHFPPEILFSLTEEASRMLSSVRVIPQSHKFLAGIL